MLALLLVSVMARVAFVSATHTFTLVNHCSSGVPVYVDNAYSPVKYVSPGAHVRNDDETNIHAYFPSIDWAAAGHYSCRLQRQYSYS